MNLKSFTKGRVLYFLFFIPLLTFSFSFLHAREEGRFLEERSPYPRDGFHTGEGEFPHRDYFHWGYWGYPNMEDYYYNPQGFAESYYYNPVTGSATSVWGPGTIYVDMDSPEIQEILLSPVYYYDPHSGMVSRTPKAGWMQVTRDAHTGAITRRSL
jgi:hypothetical protein